MKHLMLVSLVLVACGGAPPPMPSPPPIEAVQPPSPPTREGDAAPLEAPAAAGTAKNDLIPRSVLFDNPERAGVQISPDGKQLAWIAPKDGVMNVWIAPIGKLDQARAVTSDTKRPIRTYTWAYTNKHILYMQDTGGDENFHVFRVDLADGNTTDLTPFKGARASLAGGTHKRRATRGATTRCTSCSRTAATPCCRSTSVLRRASARSS